MRKKVIRKIEKNFKIKQYFKSFSDYHHQHQHDNKVI